MVRTRIVLLGVLLVCGLFPAALPGATTVVDTVFELDAAMARAETNQQDDVIILSPGTYNVGDFPTYNRLWYTANHTPVENYALTLMCTNGKAVIDGSWDQAIVIEMFVSGQQTRNAHVMLKGIEFRNGWASEQAVKGGGLYVRTQDANILIESCSFVSNRATHIFQDPDAAGGFIKAGGTGTLSILRCSFVANNADGLGGGLYVVGDSGAVVIENSIFSRNTGSTAGGGLYLSAGNSSTLRNNTFAFNNNAGWGAQCAGGGVYVRSYLDSQEATFQNNIFWTNTAATANGNDIYLENDANGNGTGSVFRLYNNDYTDLDCQVSNNLTRVANIGVDPGFAAASTGDYRLALGSPCVDAGTNLTAVTNDFAGVPRPLDGNDDHVAVMDMGAYEFVHPAADTDSDGIADVWEFQYFSSLAIATASSDFDGDTSLDVEEYVAGTDPTNPGSFPDTLVVVTVYGAAVPPAGTNLLPHNRSMSASITNSPVTSGATQYVCRGWTGTGSVPASGGTTNTGAFFLTNDSSIAWLWKTNYWLGVQAGASGTVSVTSGWFGSGSNVEITASASTHYRFAAWGGDTNGCAVSSNRITAPMTGPRSITASFIPEVALTITTPYGTAVPGAGWYVYGTTLSVAVVDSPVVTAEAKYVCTGWTGSGSVPAAGTTTNTGSFVLTSNSVVSWLWRVNHRPAWTSTGVQTVPLLTQLQFTVSATDADGSLLALSAPVAPTGSVFVDHGNGTGTFTWTPVAAGDVGNHSVSFVASDGELAGTNNATVRVSSFAVRSPGSNTVARLVATNVLGIAWQGQWPLGAVNIDLYRGPVLVTNLATGLASPAASMTWQTTLDRRMRPGTGHLIRVTNVSNASDYAISAAFTIKAKPPNDYNGDDRSDLPVYDSRNGYWYIESAGKQVIVWASQWGWPGATTVSGDYDGDGRSDLCVYDNRNGYWYIESPSGQLILWAAQWGWPGAVTVPGDYDGDGKSDLAVYDGNNGYWYVANVAGSTLIWAMQWGWAGATTVPGDYDGDGRSDLCVYDNRNGYWYIESPSGQLILWAAQWGWPGAVTVPGDYDGDGKSDLCVYDSRNGYWYIRSVSGSMILWAVQWGWPSATTVSGDYDGDGKADLAVYDNVNGYWYIRTVAGPILVWATQWGWPGALTVTER